MYNGAKKRGTKMDLERRFFEIDKKLSVLFQKMEYTEYIAFIKANDTLKLYDKILGKTDINQIPKMFRNTISSDMLDEIEKIIDNKIKEIEA